jgi:hypothetical protein
MQEYFDQGCRSKSERIPRFWPDLNKKKSDLDSNPDTAKNKNNSEKSDVKHLKDNKMYAFSIGNFFSALQVPEYI